MNKIKRYQKGSSIDFSFDREGLTISGWVCTIVVKQYSKDAATISRVITATGEVWEGFLTATETSALATGLWFLTAVLVNVTDDTVEEKVVRFGIAESWS
jgi:hypothetical protein